MVSKQLKKEVFFVGKTEKTISAFKEESKENIFFLTRRNLC